jgi:hypothetical protein
MSDETRPIDFRNQLKGIVNNPEIVVGMLKQKSASDFAESLQHEMEFWDAARKADAAQRYTREMRSRKLSHWKFCKACGRELQPWRWWNICLVCQEWATDHHVNLTFLRGIEVLNSYFYSEYR